MGIERLPETLLEIKRFRMTPAVKYMKYSYVIFVVSSRTYREYRETWVAGESTDLWYLPACCSIRGHVRFKIIM